MLILMSANRAIILSNQQIYHVYNRGVERRPVFMTKREHERMTTTIWFYRYFRPDTPLSHFLNLSVTEQVVFQERLEKKPMGVSLLAFCLMPNHFHFVLRQEIDAGISRFVANVTNSYSKYFNLKKARVGPLFQGTFKAVRVETDEQFMHLTRYVHLNPVTSFLIPLKELETYPWSSYSEYLGQSAKSLTAMKIVHKLLSLHNYRQFVNDQTEYAQKLESIKHIALDA